LHWLYPAASSGKVRRRANSWAGLCLSQWWGGFELVRGRVSSFCVKLSSLGFQT